MEKILSEIKKDFFAYRNGVMADALRKSGDPHAVIMGCMLVDVVTIARRYEPMVALASALWADVKHRECRLAAPVLFPPAEMTAEQALEWARGVQSEEEADVLCHRLLRRVASAEEVACTLLADECRLVQYAGLRLVVNLLADGTVTSRNAIAVVVERCGRWLCNENLGLLRHVVAELQSS